MKSLALIALVTLVSAAQADPVYPALPNYGLTDCDAPNAGKDICRLKQDPSEAEARSHLGDKSVAFWRDGDHFMIVAQRKAEKVTLCCAIQAPMAQWPNTDLWTLTVQSPHLDDAVIDLNLSTGDRVAGGANKAPDMAKAEAQFNGALKRTEILQWRGPKAAPAPEYYEGALRGSLHFEDIASPNLGETRRIVVYLPPGYKKGERYPVIYMADGQSLSSEARIIEPLIVAGKIRPIVVVGLYSGDNLRRAADYLIGLEGDKFFTHEAFLLKEVMPRAESQYGAAGLAKDRMIFGFSNGAGWAIDVGLRHPELFGHIAALSLGTNGMRGVNWNPGRQTLYLSAGLFEPGFLHTTSANATAARAAGVETTFVTHATGHSSLAWDLSLVDSLVRVFGKS